MKLKFLIPLLLLPVLAAAQSNWDSWLKEEGFYLLGPKEKERFLALPETERELYVRDLWSALDPDPITPENEFEAEYKKRVQYAKKHFGIPSDRAKIYILLGEPNSVERHPNSDKYYPLELWSYFSLGFRGLPSSLDLIFFKRWGTGDYRLYSPLFDGMKSLTPSQMDFESPRARAMIKAYFDSQIVEAAERVAPGTGVNESEEIRLVLQDPDAFSRIERKKPSVETTVVYEGFQADVATYAIPHDAGIMKTSIALTIPPRYMTFEKEDAQYRARVDLIGRISDEKGNEILRINDSPALKLVGEEFQKAQAYHFSYMFDAFLLPGKYELDILYRDYASNAAGKIESSFAVPAPADDLRLAPLLLAFKSTAAPPELPFSYNQRQLIPKENGAFSNGQSLILYTRLQNPKKQKLEGVWKLRLGLRKDSQDTMEVQEDLAMSGTEDVPIERRLRLQGLVPGTYELVVRLAGKDGEYEIATPVRISASPEVLGRLRVTASPTRSPESYHVNVALQYYYRGDYDSAARHARIATDFAPTLYSARSLSARIEKARGNADAAMAAYEKLLEEAPADSEGFFLMGKWSMEQKNWQKAADLMKKALSMGYSTTELLNNLGSVEKQMGNTREAIGYWERSLAIDSNQPEITKLIAENKAQ